MLIDARQIDQFATLTSEVCIIGAGAAGITMALQLAGRNIKVVVLEGGGFNPDAATQSLYAGESVGLAHEPPAESRSRYLGGSTNCWGGWCRPLDEMDFEARPWIANSGWPIRKSEMLPYYKRSHSLLELGDFNYNIDHWSLEFAKNKAALFSIEGSGLCNVINHLSPPTRFGSAYRVQLNQALNVKLILFANATEVLTDETVTQATGVKVQTLNHKSFTVSAEVVVLAAGGIENPRLLLLSNKTQTAGLGNGRDLVGRYYMDHPRIQALRVTVDAAERYRALYDATLIKTRQRWGQNFPKLAAHLAPTPDMQRRLKLPNFRTYLVARHANDLSKSYFALKALRRSFYARKQFRYSYFKVARDVALQLPILLAHAPRTALTLADVLLSPVITKRDFNLETVLEPVPNPESRVSLSIARDQLGLNQVKIDWRLTDQDREHYSAASKIVVASLTKSGIVSSSDICSEGAECWPKNIVSCWHHMGTTRMCDDPARGVVDADCKVHGFHNLFIAGSSVFPTAGSDSPTITLVALALRLCDKILNDLRIKQMASQIL